MAETIDFPGQIATVSKTGGIKLEGHDDWFNQSKYVQPPISIPPRGTQVVLHCKEHNGKYYVQSITTTGAPPAAASRQNGDAGYTNGGDARDLRITRMASINSAIALLSSGGRTASEADAFALAGRIYGWVTQAPPSPATESPSGVIASPSPVTNGNSGAPSGLDEMFGTPALTTYLCGDCGKEIGDVVTPKGKAYTAKEWADWSRERLQAQTCYDCACKRAATQRGG